jgi:hypothetical protein
MTEIIESDVKYIYAIIRASESCSFETAGIGGRGNHVYTINDGRLAAVVSDSAHIEYDSTRRNMMTHQLVLEEVMKRFSVLPVRFGTTAADSDVIVEKLLNARRNELDHLLEQMRDRVELGLKASWREEVVFREIIEENPSIRKLRDGIATRPANSTHFDRIQLGERIAKALDIKRTSDEQLILNHLKPFVHKTKLNKPIGDQMVINAAFLIEQYSESSFDEAIREMESKVGKRFLFKYVGPVPPYNFVNIVVSWT